MEKPEAVEAAPSTSGANGSVASAASGLIIFVRGLHPFFPSRASYQRIEQLLKDKLPNHELYAFHYWGTYWSSADPEKLGKRLEEEIRKKTATKSYDQLYLVGHSFGALLIRQAVLFALDLGGQSHEWLSKVKRLILLAGANRGFQPYTGLTESIAAFGTLLQRLPLLPPFLRLGRLAIYGLRGSVWVTKLRMHWVQMSAQEESKLPFTVQIRGTQDRLVGPNDSRDVSVSRNSLELLIEDVGHRDLALLIPQHQEEVVEKLAPKIEAALKAEPQRPSARVGPKHVVFLIHGIRDFAEWHEDLGETITQVAGGPEQVEIVPISYGYFSALQFLFPTARRRCARSFLDRYVQYFARYPNAQFSALAHSNGTFALAWALRNNQYIKLQNVFLAGSVLPRKFPWQSLQTQITHVRNDCANADWPVGALCWVLSWVPAYRRDLGTAGVDGFTGPTVHGDEGVSKASVCNNKFRYGGHSAALEAKYHEEIAKFLLNGDPWSITTNLSQRKGTLLRLVLRVLVLAGAAGCGYLFYLISVAGLAPPLIVMLTVVATLALICVLLLI